MINFQDYLMSEMSAQLVKAQETGDKDEFLVTLKQDLMSAVRQINGDKAHSTYGVEVVDRARLHEPDDQHKWPYVTCGVKGNSGETIHIVIAVPNEDDFQSFKKFDYYVNGQKKQVADATSFGTLRSSPTYHLYAIQNVALKKRAAGGDASKKLLKDATVEELEEELRKRRAGQSGEGGGGEAPAAG